MAELDVELDAVNIELSALDAYEAAKAGKTPTQRTAGTRRARKGSRREEMLNLIRNSDGLTRGELMERLGVRGDKQGEASVSNALVTLKKQGVLEHEGGRYRGRVVQEAMWRAAE